MAVWQQPEIFTKVYRKPKEKKSRKLIRAILAHKCAPVLP
jgi:hypothetical protein